MNTCSFRHYDEYMPRVDLTSMGVDRPMQADTSVAGILPHCKALNKSLYEYMIDEFKKKTKSII